MRILVAEDDPETAEFVRRGLSELGHNIAVVGNGTDALHLLLVEEFEIAILDRMLPGLDGVSVVRRVTCFNGLGRVVAQHATKGLLVSVKGRIHNSKWTDKDGIDRYGYEIIADDVQFLGRPKQPNDPAEAPDDEHDLPL